MHQKHPAPRVMVSIFRWGAGVGGVVGSAALAGERRKAEVSARNWRWVMGRDGLGWLPGYGPYQRGIAGVEGFAGAAGGVAGVDSHLRSLQWTRATSPM